MCVHKKSVKLDKSKPTGNWSVIWADNTWSTYLTIITLKDEDLVLIPRPLLDTHFIRKKNDFRSVINLAVKSSRISLWSQGCEISIKFWPSKSTWKIILIQLREYANNKIRYSVSFAKTLLSDSSKWKLIPPDIRDWLDLVIIWPCEIGSLTFS